MKFTRLADAHREIELLFHRHQLMLVERNADNATATLSLFASALAHHAHEEESLIYPAYALVGARKGASLDALEAEHRKLDELLRAIVERLEAIHPPYPPENVLSLLELEHRFRSLLEHHFLREENVVFPALDARLDAAERDRLMGKIDRSAIPSEALVPSPS